MAEYCNALGMLKNEYSTDSSSDENCDTFGTPIDSYVSQEKRIAGSRLAVPESLKNLYKDDKDNVNDQHESHNGRIRSFAHERGNWATYVFIPVANCGQFDLLCNTLISSCKIISEFYSCVDVHVSLSRTVVLRYHWIDSFVKTIAAKTKMLKCFSIDFDTVNIYMNEEETRTFIGIRVQLGYDSLMECVRRIDSAFADFKLPVYYQNPSFHISLIWCLGNKKDDLARILPQLKKQFHELKNEKPLTWIMLVKKLKCKIGNRLYKFNMLN